MTCVSERPLKVRLKSKKTRTVSQKRWLERQLNDPYVARAKREGMRSRAAYKLIEIDDKYRLLKPGGARRRSRRRARRLERGCGEARRRRGGQGQGRRDRHSRHEADRGRRLHASSISSIRLRPRGCAPMLGGGADVVLSDMAANATGHKKTDQLKIMALVEAAAEFAREVLRPGGSFLAKVLQGGTERALLADLKRDFATVRHVKPQASRADSSELYLLATGFRGGGRWLTATPSRGPGPRPSLRSSICGQSRQA